MSFDILSSLNYDLSPSDSIVDTPSLVTPILLKKQTLKQDHNLQQQQENSFSNTNQPVSDTNSLTNNNNKILVHNNRDHHSNPTNQEHDDDIQIIKIIARNATSDDNNTDKTYEQIDQNIVQPSIDPPMNNYRELDEYIKDAAMSSVSGYPQINKDKQILTIYDYFRSAPGKLLLGIGLSRVLEYNLEADARRISKKLKTKCGDSKKMADTLNEINQKLVNTKVSNKIYKTNYTFKCPHCPFRSDLEVVMNGHLEKPHQDKKKLFLCNWCDYKIRDPNMIIHHCFLEHKKRCYLDNPLPNHVCCFCSFEAKSKRQLQSHQLVCEQNFSLNTCLEPIVDDLHYPAVTSKFIFKKDIAAYERILQDIRLACYSPNILKVPGSQQSANGYQPVCIVPNKNLPIATQPDPSSPIVFNYSRGSASFRPVPDAVTRPRILSKLRTKSTSSNPFTNPSRLMALLAERNIPRNTVNNILQFPTNLPTSFTNGRLGLETVPSVVMKHHPAPQLKKARYQRGSVQSEDPEISPGPSPSSSNPKNSTFVICEICDWYIKDLAQLKSHMQLYHKVKLHQRTLLSRPPLNCQKCQWRFFTDQGLERHLLGAHGLVTSNMQELVEEGNDSGRCTVCGRAFASKLVGHMKDIHKLNLKPAHLSYKCTVCAATFNLYRLFENHVYTVHSDSVKNADYSTSAATQ